MKNSAEYAKKLKKLCTTAKKNKDVTDLVDNSAAVEPASLLALAALSEFTTISKAQTAYRKLKSNFVDFNELRVSRPREIILAIGVNFPNAGTVAATLIKVLNSVFEKHDGLDMAGLSEMGKREALAVVKEIKGLTPYMLSVFQLYYLESHAFPLNEHMWKVFQEEGIVNPDSDYADVHGFLDRQIPAAKGRELFVTLRDYCDSFELAEKKEDKKTAAKTSAKKKVAKKTVAKKSAAKTATTKKTTAKTKTAKKKTTKKKTK